MNVDVYYVDVDKFGFINMRSLELLLHNAYNEAKEILVSIQFANNEIGTTQSIKEIAELVHKYNGLFHTDAVQAIGQFPIDVKELEIDMLSCSGHKLSAPKGIGFLYKKNGVEIDPLIYGSQMDGMRGGTENVAYIVGMAKAIELCDVSDDKIKGMYRKRDYFINELIRKFGCMVNGSLDSRLPNSINVTFPQNITGEALLYLLDIRNILISTGSACNSKSVEPSYVLKAINLSDEQAMRTIRISLSSTITYKDIDMVIDEIEKCLLLIQDA
jgi:cysteine desulfurase